MNYFLKICALCIFSGSAYGDISSPDFKGFECVEKLTLREGDSYKALRFEKTDQLDSEQPAFQLIYAPTEIVARGAPAPAGTVLANKFIIAWLPKEDPRIITSTEPRNSGQLFHEIQTRLISVKESSCCANQLYTREYIEVSVRVTDASMRELRDRKIVERFHPSYCKLLK